MQRSVCNEPLVGEAHTGHRKRLARTPQTAKEESKSACQQPKFPPLSPLESPLWAWVVFFLFNLQHSKVGAVGALIKRPVTLVQTHIAVRRLALPGAVHHPHINAGGERRAIGDRPYGCGGEWRTSTGRPYGCVGKSDEIATPACGLVRNDMRLLGCGGETEENLKFVTFCCICWQRMV